MIDRIWKYTTTYKYFLPQAVQYNQYMRNGFCVIWVKNINMETIKSYLNRIKFPSVSSSTSVASNGRKKEKLSRKGSLQQHGSSKTSKKNKYQNHDPLTSRDSNGFASINSVKNNGNIDLNNDYEIAQCTMVSTLKLGLRLENSIGKKSPPPIKPPRRDKIFIIDLNVKGGGELGLSIDAVDLFSVENYFYGESPTRKRIYSDRGIDSMNGYADIVEVLRIVNIKNGGIVEKDGRIHIYDEILEVNGQSLQKETVGSARLLLAYAVKTGRLTMTLRRRKKRPALPPPSTSTALEIQSSESSSVSPEMSSHLMTSSHTSRMHSSYSSHMTHKQSDAGHVTSHLHSSQNTSNHVSHVTSQFGNNVSHSHTSSQVTNHVSHVSLSIKNQAYQQRSVVNQVNCEENIYEPVEVTNGVYRQRNLSQSLNSFLNVDLENDNNNGSSCTLNSLMYNSEYASSNDDVFSESTSRQSNYDPPYSVTVTRAIPEKNKSSYVNLDIDKQRTLSASAVEENVQWKAIPIDLPQEDNSYVSTAEIARKKREQGLNKQFNNTLNSDSSLYKSDPELINIQRKHFRKNRKSPRYTSNREGSDLSSNNSSSARPGNQKKKRVVTKMHLIKDDNGLGIHIAGGKGSRKGDLGIFVAEVSKGGAADRDGRLKRGDELLMINGKSLIGLTHEEAVDVMRHSPKLVQIVVASKIKRSGTLPSMSSALQNTRDCSPSSKSADVTQQIPDLTAETPHGTVMKWEELFEEIFTDSLKVENGKNNITEFKFSRPTDKPEDKLSANAVREQTIKSKTCSYEAPQSITINKGARGKGLGFTIVGGSDSEKGNLGIFVRRILPRGLVAEEGSMKEGDEIVELNGVKITGYTHREALAKFRKLKRGPVAITFRRRVRSRPNSPHCSGRVISGGGDLSSDGSPVSTPGHSPYSSCTNLANIDDEFSGFDDDIEGRNQCKLNFGKICQNKDVILTNCLDMEKTDGGNERPSSVMNPTVKCEILLQKEQGIGLGIQLMRRDQNGTSYIYIQDIKPGSPSEKDGRLKKEDMILEVNGRSLQNLSLLDAHQIFRGLQPGNVTLSVKRKQKYKTIIINVPKAKPVVRYTPSKEQGDEGVAEPYYRRKITVIKMDKNHAEKQEEFLENIQRETTDKDSEGEYRMESTESDLSDWESRTFGKIHLKSPPMVHHDDDSSNSDNPHLTPSKRRYPNTFNNDFRSEASIDAKKKNMDGFHFNKENIPTNWNNSLTSRDSALGGSLISAYGSALTDSSSSFDAQSNSESETLSSVSSPAHSTYGRYRKIYGSGSESTENEQTSDGDAEEIVVLHRLPGENLGMILGIEGDKTKEHISSVHVKSVTIGGAAYRATGSSKGIAVGDEILQVNGLDLKTLSHDECITVFKEMPLRVILKIRRKTSKRTKNLGTGSENNGIQKSFVKRYSLSESEEDSHDGFVPHQFEIDKDPKESLGLSIVPSYGSTRQYFQIKRLLPSGAAARSQKLKVGDRLVSCNGINLCGVNQTKCLSILKSEANNGDFEIEVLRPVENDIPTEFSLTVSNGNKQETNVILKSPLLNKRFSDNPFDTESEAEVVLNSFQNFDNLFASKTVKLSYQKPECPSSQQTKYTSDASVDSDSSFEKDLNSNNNKTKKMGSEEWGFALPPPAEFSDTPENYGEEPISVTSIDDVLNDYSPTCSNMSTPIHQPTPPENMKMIEALVGLEDDNEVSAEFPLTEIEESPLEQTSNTNDQFNENGHTGEDNIEDECSNQVVDNYLRLQKEDNKTNFVNTNGDFSSERYSEIDNPEKQSDQKPEKKSKNIFKLVGKVHQFYYNSSDSLSQSENGDDELIQPVKVKKEFCVPDFMKEHGQSNVLVVDEEAIAPAVIERNNKLPFSAKFDVDGFDEAKPVEKQPDFPQPTKSDSPTLPETNRDKSHKPRPPKVEYDGDEIVETFIPVKVKKEEYSKIIEEKLGRGIEEETIVPSEVKRDNSFSDNVQLVMMTNRWASATKEKTGKDITFSGMVNQIKTTDDNIDHAVAIQDGISEEIPSKEEEFHHKEEEQTVNEDSGKNINFENIGREIAKKVVENSLNEIGNSIGKQNNNENELSEETETGDYKTEISVAAQYKEVPQKNSEVENVSEKKTRPSLNDPKEVKADSSQLHKTSVAVTTPHSILGTIHSKTSTSATIKPLSTVKPLSFNSLSLNRPNRYTTTINTGSKPSLLSTIYSKTHSVSSNVRSEKESFLVSVMKGILGIGMKVEVIPEGYVQVTEVQSSGPVGKDGNIRVGDYILSINSTELTGLPDHKVQQILRLLPRGLAKLVVSVTPPNITKSDISSSKTRPPDLSINTSHTVQRRLTPALSPKNSERKVTSPRSSYTSSPTTQSKSIKPLSPALSPTTHKSPVVSSTTSPTMSPTSQRSPVFNSPTSPSNLSCALSPRKTSSHQQQAASRPNVMPRQTVTHDAKEPPVSQEQVKPSISPRRPVEETFNMAHVSNTKREPPPVAPKPKPRSLPQQTETATHHKITPSVGGYVSSAVGQSKHSHGPSSVDKEHVMTSHHADYVSSARKAVHDTDDEEPIDTVIFASVSSNQKTDYALSARKTYEEPKMIPSGIIDYVPKEKPKAAERIKPASFHVLPTTGSSEGGVKIAPVRLNSALSPRKKGSDQSFNFNAKLSYEDKALPRAGYFVGKPDVVTSPKHIDTSLDEVVSVPTIASPRSEGDNSLSCDSTDSQIYIVACAPGDDLSMSPDNSSTSPDILSMSPDSSATTRLDSVFSHIPETIPLPILNSEIKLSDDLDYHEKHLNDDALGVVHEAELVSDFSNNQEKIPDSKNVLHGESNNLYMHDDKSKDENISSLNTNTLEIYLNENRETTEKELDISVVSLPIEKDCSVSLNILCDNETVSQHNISCMNSQVNVESQPACTNFETEDIAGESSRHFMHENVCDITDDLQDKTSSVQFFHDSDTISLEQEPLGSEDQPTGAIVEDDKVIVDFDVDKTHLDINQDHVDSLIVDSVPPGFSDDVDMLKNSDIDHHDQIDLKDSSVNLLTRDSVINEPIINSSLSLYNVKFPAVGSSDLVVVSSQRPFSIICGKQTVSVNTKSNTLEDVMVCDLLVSTSMLTSDLQLANQKMDSFRWSNDYEISVILLEREDNTIPVGLNLFPGPNGNMTVSQLDPAGLVQQSGHIRPSDTVILINGEIVTKENADAILQSLENSESHLICVVISRNLHVQARGDNPVEVQTRGDNPVEIQTAVNKLPHSPTSDENGNKKIVTDSEQTDSEPEDGILEITMVKGVTGLGFLIEGGLGSPRGDIPVKIKRMFKGGAATKCGLLKVGDELVKVNGVDMAKMKHTEAWNFLKFLDDGDVKLLIRRTSEC